MMIKKTWYESAKFIKITHLASIILHICFLLIPNFGMIQLILLQL